MNKTFSLEQISKTGNLDTNLKLRQNNLDLMSRVMEIKSNNPNITQKQTAKKLGDSDCTIISYRDEINMASPYKKKNTKRNKMSFQEPSMNSSRAKPSSASHVPFVSGAFEASTDIIDEKYLDKVI